MKIKIVIALLFLLTLIGTTCSVRQKHIKELPSETEIQASFETVSEESTTTVTTTKATTAEQTTEEPHIQTTVATTAYITTTKAETTKPATTTRKAETTTKATTVAETTTQKPTSTEPTTEEYIDIDYYINYAIEYGKSIGLEYDSTATGCWDTPIGVLSDNEYYVTRDIKDRLDFYKNVEGDEYFCVWAERRSYREFWLFIGYA